MYSCIFNEKDYEKAIVEGNDLLQEDISSAYKAEVHKIIMKVISCKSNMQKRILI